VTLKGFILALFVTILPLPGGALWAQEPAEATSDSDQPEPEPQSPTAADGGETVQGQSRPQSAPAGDSPFDYEASEQISEDLSVSFPVDI
jgi:hypothetical protein